MNRMTNTMYGKYYKDLEYEYGITCKNTCKHYHNNHNAINRHITTKNFLLQCRKEKLIPTFIINRTKHLTGNMMNYITKGKMNNFLTRTNKQLLNIEITNIITKIMYLKRKTKIIQQKLYKLAPQHTINSFIHHIKHPKHNKTTSKTEKLDNKRIKLSLQQTNKIKYNPEWLKNLTTITIPKDIETMLAFGPKFAVFPNKNEVPIHNLIAGIENIISEFKDTGDTNTIRGKATTIISNHTKKTDQHINRRQLILRKAYTNTKKFLKKQPKHHNHKS